MDPDAANGPSARMLPDVPLYGPDGGAVRLSDYRHRKHLVLLLFGAHPGEGGDSVPVPPTARRAEFAEENAEIVAVYPASPPASSRPSPFPFPVLVDRDRAFSRELRENGPRGAPALSVHVADRYGELFRSLVVGAGEPFPADEILSWLRFLERLCPE